MPKKLKGFGLVTRIDSAGVRHITIVPAKKNTKDYLRYINKSKAYAKKRNKNSIKAMVDGNVAVVRKVAKKEGN